MAAQTPGSTPIHLYKNNTDNKGASYGAHENYLMPRSTPFGDIVRHLTPFFVSRQVVCGSGRVGIGQDGREHGFQLSQRADYFEVEVGLETTLKRPIINTRDEPHADPEKYRRLHVIIGDANLAEISTYLKVGTTALVLAMIEDRFITADLTIDGPVAALRAVSHDPTLREQVTLNDGRQLTALQLQGEYLELARKYVDDRLGSDADAQTVDVLDRWESVLSRLAQDPMLCARELDWVAKLKLLNSYRERDGIDWDNAKLQLIDYQYSDIRPEKGLYHRLVQLRPHRPAAHRRRRGDRDAPAARRHARLLPRALSGEVRRLRRGRVVGLGDLRPARARVAAAGADDRPAARVEGPRGRPHRPVRDRRGPVPGADEPVAIPSGDLRPGEPPSRPRVPARVRESATNPLAFSSSTTSRRKSTDPASRSRGVATACRICMNAGSRTRWPGCVGGPGQGRLADARTRFEPPVGVHLDPFVAADDLRGRQAAGEVEVVGGAPLHPDTHSGPVDVARGGDEARLGHDVDALDRRRTAP